MAKGSVITEGLFQTVKQLQEIHRGYKAEQLAPLVCREATVVRKIMKCRTWEEYCEYKKAKAYHEIAESLFDIRKPIDKLEEVVDNDMWPLPKYRELLFIS